MGSAVYSPRLAGFGRNPGRHHIRTVLGATPFSQSPRTARHFSLGESCEEREAQLMLTNLRDAFIY